MELRFLPFLFFILFFLVSGKQEEKWSEKNLQNYYSELENKCLINNCKDIGRYENKNCIHKCISETCYASIYMDEPLEPGEIDIAREDLFISCVKAELVKNIL